MKKLLVTILTILLTFTLAACGNSESSQGDNATKPAESEETTTEDATLDDEEAKQKEKEEAEKLAALEAEEKAKKEAEEQAKLEEEKKAKEEAEKQAALEAEQKAREEAEAQRAATVESLGLVEATVSRVVDGDTVELSDGNKVRLIGVNTPESTNKTEEYGKEASNYTTSELEGQTVWLQKDVSETDRYGRLLRLVWTEVPSSVSDEGEIRNKMFNANLVLSGYAEPSTYQPDSTYSEYFVKFAKEARSESKGLWAYGEEGTTKGDLDSSSSNSTSSNASGDSSSSSNESSSSSSSSDSSEPSSSSSSTSESFANCTELRKVYPNGVPEGHAAYQSKMDRDKDGYACER